MKLERKKIRGKLQKKVFFIVKITIFTPLEIMPRCSAAGLILE